MNSSVEVSEAVSGIRRVEPSDYDAICGMVNEESIIYFGTDDIIAKIERCFVSLCVLDKENAIIAVGCFDDRPNIPSMLASEWPHWLKSRYEFENVHPANSLWVHYLVYSQCPHECIKPMLRKLFSLFPALENTLYVSPNKTTPLKCIEIFFTLVMQRNLKFSRKVQTIYIALRHQFVEKYIIRSAVEQDNDDVVPLIDTHSKRLREMYGDYYISEILTHRIEINREIVVAMYKDQIVAVACIKGNVDYETLAREFCLEPFGLLREIEGELDLCFKEVVPSEIKNQLFGPTYTMSTRTNDSNTNLLEQSEKSLKTFGSMSLSAAAVSLIDVNAKIINMYNNKQTGSEKTIFSPSKEMIDSQFTFEEIREENETYLLESQQINQAVNMEKENAIALEILAAYPEHESKVLPDLLEACFQTFPSREYCILTVPSDRTHFPLNNFVKVVPRSMSVYPQELYALHRNALKPNLTVRWARAEDSEALQLFARTVYKQNVLPCVMDSVADPGNGLESYVMLDGTVIVALGVVSENCDFDYLRCHFRINEYVNYRSHKYERVGVIEHAIVSPIFDNHACFFLREIHRLSDMAILFYIFDNEELLQLNTHRTLPGLLRQLFPVKGTRNITYPANNGEEVNLPDYVTQTKASLCLHMSTRRLLSFPITNIDSRIVVVGASNTGLSFLETLIHTFDNSRHVIFTNLTLVYKYDISTRDVYCSSNERMLIYKGHYSSFYMNTVGFRAYVNIIKGTMMEINRKNKYITMDNGRILPYDLLFLMCGCQFEYPIANNVPGFPVKQPRNVFVINKQIDVEMALANLNALLKYKRGSVIIYGTSLHTYCCIETLLSIGVSSQCIVLVEPFVDSKKSIYRSIFNNQYVDKEMKATLEKLKIEHHQLFNLKQMHIVDKFVEFVEFESKREIISINCCAMFFYPTLKVAYNTFLACNRAGLVFDGKLVIKPNCQTNDEFIYAAGPMTKYSRKYYADAFVHKYYDSHEIGERLARQIRVMLLSGGSETNDEDSVYETTEKWNRLVPQYKYPTTTFCNLPGDIKYLFISKPGLPLLEDMFYKNRGKSLVTGQTFGTKGKDRTDYFRLHFNSRERVDSITCFTTRDINVNNLKCLYGKHATLLNNVIARFDNEDVSNLYDFFAEPWATLLYFEGFKALHSSLMDIMFLNTRKPGNSLILDLLKYFNENDWNQISPRFKSQIMDKFIDSEYQNRIQNLVMDFIRDNLDHFSMYAHPVVTKEMLEDYTSSALFNKN